MKKLCLIAFLLLVACGGEQLASVEVDGVSTLAVGDLVSQPTSAALADTPAAPTTTATLPPPPTMAAPATPTSIPTPTPLPVTPTPEVVNLLTAEDFGPDRNPLTGEVVADPAALDRLPIACKISNSPAKYTRPQSGLNDADLVFEHINLWSSTRFTAIFYSKSPSEVGPVRSARLIDVELPAMYHAALCFSGANVGVSRRLFGSDISSRILRSNIDGYYNRDDLDRPSEHTLFVDLELLREELARRELNERPIFDNVVPFTSTPPDGGTPAKVINIELIDEFARWEYQPENGRYWRWSKEEPHLDALTGEQLNFRNVIILFVPHIDDMSICAVPNADGSCAAHSIEIQLWGRGEGMVLRDGLAYDVTWRREKRGDMLTFFDAAGNPVSLQIGNSFFQVLPTWGRRQVEILE